MAVERPTYLRELSPLYSFDFDSYCESNLADFHLKRTQHSGARFPEMADFNARKETFFDWPVHKHQGGSELAEAGFFYGGESDRTRCFYCGGGLRNWLADDLPWTEHIRWFPDCDFVKSRTNMDTTETSESYVGPKNEQCRQILCGTEHEENRTVSESIIEDLLEENERLRRERNCKLCLDREVGVLTLPCAHLATCVQCSAGLKHCVVCRRVITYTVRTYT